ncbi:hypothetical protein EYF80_040208 [Liparis tanakae]|uniref:Uncharacterized protein n=1 Tax=Liparis tanakae TaxID=230148 RepID=A0A4Z2G8U9_9TELE|nr:hypothetical protein EYF80_040208 [Liparis tanakae]
MQTRRYQNSGSYRLFLWVLESYETPEVLGPARCWERWSWSTMPVSSSVGPLPTRTPPNFCAPCWQQGTRYSESMPQMKDFHHL